MKITRRQLQTLISESLTPTLEDENSEIKKIVDQFLNVDHDPSYWVQGIELLADLEYIPTVTRWDEERLPRIEVKTEKYLGKTEPVHGVSAVYGSDLASAKQLESFLKRVGIKDWYTARFGSEGWGRGEGMITDPHYTKWTGLWYRSIVPNGVFIFNAQDWK